MQARTVLVGFGEAGGRFFRVLYWALAGIQPIRGLEASNRKCSYYFLIVGPGCNMCNIVISCWGAYIILCNLCNACSFVFLRKQIHFLFWFSHVTCVTL